MFRSYILLFSVLIINTNQAQDGFPEDPQAATFVTSDIQHFWTAFDAMASADGNPFDAYIEAGSVGLQGFIPHRIISADSLRNMVRRRKADYEAARDVEMRIKEKEKLIKPYFYALEYWYPEAVYPPVYFVMGRFNSGGTTSENGLIIGAEMLSSMDHLAGLVVHESIHFQQKWPENGSPNLLQQSILEGSADFIAELVTGIKGNVEANTYGRANRERLCKEFIDKMYGDDYEDWLYGTSGKDDRPNDLGYWIGYEIVNAYFDKTENKKRAVAEILNIDDYDDFVNKGGYLNPRMK